MNIDMNEPTKLNQQMCFALYEANKKFNRFYAEVLDPFNLTYPQYLVLLNLWEKDHSVTMRELGKELALDSGTLTPLLKRLESRGWIVRKKDPSDERHVLVELTDKAIQNKGAIVNKVSSCLNHLNMQKNEYLERLNDINDISDRLDNIIADI
ncbi:MarR family transcriptional regulator [Paucilactobacillus suebicus]|uniref:Transcription regulator n=1 Tax=Paucilactobacillus suebicus DSM 5007 = KCTC 3549 TaxID=1423807 RepID=A0A0R1W6D8_9LACO|nr:MarR family transcriptional regulator [Paucilactobacillus suebicus]KRM10870.1 transcription regulator [Paucilactobacillus suebicus DSM 5007 = KCTC 3549]